MAAIAPSRIRTRVSATARDTFRHAVTVSVDILDLNLDDLQDRLAEGGEPGVLAAIQEAIDADPELRKRLWDWVGARAISDALVRYARMGTDGELPMGEGVPLHEAADKGEGTDAEPANG